MCVEWMLSTELMVEKVRSMIALLPLTRRNNNAISLTVNSVSRRMVSFFAMLVMNKEITTYPFALRTP